MSRAMKRFVVTTFGPLALVLVGLVGCAAEATEEESSVVVQDGEVGAQRRIDFTVGYPTEVKLPSTDTVTTDAGTKTP